jgi:hypothetical protein
VKGQVHPHPPPPTTYWIGGWVGPCVDPDALKQHDLFVLHNVAQSLPWVCYCGYLAATVVVLAVVTLTVFLLGRRKRGKESHAIDSSLFCWFSYSLPEHSLNNNFFHMQKKDLRNCSATSGISEVLNCMLRVCNFKTNIIIWHFTWRLTLQLRLMSKVVTNRLRA